MTPSKLFHHQNSGRITRRLASFAILLVSVFLLSACATHRVQLDRMRQLRDARGAEIRILYAGENEWDARLIADALKAGRESWQRLGTLNAPVDIIIHPTHHDLVKTVHREPYGWLRAWATYDRVHVQAPTTWGGAAIAERVRQVLIHEMTHVVMYQMVGDKTSWKTREIPLWFREGLASVTAGQGSIRWSVARLQEEFAKLPAGSDPFRDGHKLAKSHQKFIYSLGHWAVHYLIVEYGYAGMRNLLAGMRAGAPFAQAVEQAFDLPLNHIESPWRTALSNAATRHK